MTRGATIFLHHQIYLLAPFSESQDRRSRSWDKHCMQILSSGAWCCVACGSKWSALKCRIILQAASLNASNLQHFHSGSYFRSYKHKVHGGADGTGIILHNSCLTASPPASSPYMVGSVRIDMTVTLKARHAFSPSSPHTLSLDDTLCRFISTHLLESFRSESTREGHSPLPRGLQLSRAACSQRLPVSPKSFLNKSHHYRRAAT